MRAHRVLLAALALAACRDPNAPNPEGQGAGAIPYEGPGAPPPQQAQQQQPQRPQLTPQDIAAHVAAAQLPAPPKSMRPIAPPAGATFGNGTIRYLGWEFAPEKPFPGGLLRITHYWEALKPIPSEWTIFVHLAPPGVQGVMLNGDHVAIQGLYPTSQWKVGAIFRDDELMRLPSQVPAGPLDMYVGLYQGNQRMPLDQTALGAENRLRVGQIPIGEPPNLTLPTYKVPRAKGPITIDGKLDEPDWARAPSTGAFVRSMDGGKTRYQTEAKLLWDDQYLYVAFTCLNPDVWSTYTKHDEPLYNQEVVELFIDADGDGKTYNELEISPANVTFDANFKERRKDLEKAILWDSGMKTAVVLKGTLNDPADIDQGWVAEAAIPIANLDSVPHVPPHPGDRWRANLYHLYRVDAQTGAEEGAAWSPLFVGDFHALNRFGWLEFQP